MRTVFAAALFFLLLSCRPAPETAAPGPSSEARRRIQEFWRLYNAANTQRHEGEFEAAAAGFRKALELDPKHEDSLYNLALSLEESGDVDGAVSTLRRLIEVNPASGRGLSHLGGLLSTPAPGFAPDYDEGLEILRRSIQLNREQSGSFLRIGMLELNRRRRKEAMESFRIAAGFGSPEGNYWLGYTLYLEGRRAGALAALQKVIDGFRHERALSGQGIKVEGDTLPDPAKPLNPLEAAAVKSMLLARWIRNPPPTPDLPFRLRTGSESFSKRLEAVREIAARHSLAPRASIVDIVQADFDKDGAQDLLVLDWRRHPVLLLSRQSSLVDATSKSGLASVRFRGFSAVALDYDRDGALDILLATHAPFPAVARTLMQPDFTPQINTPFLFRNRGDATFEDVTVKTGLAKCFGAMQALAADFDSDGWTDILLVNGSLDALRIEPSVILRNHDGQAFRPWRTLAPSNFTGASLEPNSALRLHPNPLG